MRNTVTIQLTNGKRRTGLQRLGLLPVVILVLTAYAAIYHFYLAYYLFEWMARGAKAAPGVQMFAILFLLNGLGYLALVSPLYLSALKQVRRITGFLLIGYTALTMLLWYLLGNRSTEGLMDYAVNIVEGVLLVLLLVKSGRAGGTRPDAHTTGNARALSCRPSAGTPGASGQRP